jgi:large subunit ribosomal protein L17
MKHRIFGKKLGRNHNERKALFNSLTKAMFISGSINTTQARATAIVSTIEKLSNTIITKPDLFARRELFKVLQDQTWVNNVFKTFKETFGEQSSNFTKITKIKRRFGDDALIVKLSFVKPIKFEIKKEKKVETKKNDKKDPKKIKDTKKNIKETK